MTGVLDGVRVLDFGRYIAGPYCATMLGFLGAEIIRIEKRAGGEDRYAYPLYYEDDGTEGMGSPYLPNCLILNALFAPPRQGRLVLKP